MLFSLYRCQNLSSSVWGGLTNIKKNDVCLIPRNPTPGVVRKHCETDFGTDTARRDTPKGFQEKARAELSAHVVGFVWGGRQEAGRV